jgi:hypothetical protein
MGYLAKHPANEMMSAVGLGAYFPAAVLFYCPSPIQRLSAR